VYAVHSVAAQTPRVGEAGQSWALFIENIPNYSIFARSDHGSKFSQEDGEFMTHFLHLEHLDGLSSRNSDPLSWSGLHSSAQI